MTIQPDLIERVARVLWPLAEWDEYRDAENAARAALEAAGITTLQAQRPRADGIDPTSVQGTRS